MPDATPDQSPLDAWTTALEHSHRRLADAVAPLSADQVAGPSYDREWSIAQVLSHLGSGAEIFQLFLRAGLLGEDPPGPEAFAPIWARWDAKPPVDQAADAVVTDRAFVDRLLALDDAERAAWSLDLFGERRGFGELLRLRLGEHALHTWDVVVMDDPHATVAPDAVGLLIDGLGQLVARAGRPAEEAVRVHITTTNPARRLLIEVDAEGARLTPSDGVPARPGDATVSLPAEALIRLVYGRLDEGHTPALEGDTAVLDDLRAVFPGF